HVGVAMIGAAVAVFARGTAELRHRDYDGIFSEVSEVDPERAQRLREFAQHVCNLTLRAALVDVMVPAADVGKGHLYAQVSFDQLGKLPEAVAKSSARIVHARRRLVLG